MVLVLLGIEILSKIGEHCLYIITFTTVLQGSKTNRSLSSKVSLDKSSLERDETQRCIWSRLFFFLNLVSVACLIPFERPWPAIWMKFVASVLTFVSSRSAAALNSFSTCIAIKSSADSFWSDKLLVVIQIRAYLAHLWTTTAERRNPHGERRFCEMVAPVLTKTEFV